MSEVSTDAPKINRRDFLKLAGLSLLAGSSLPQFFDQKETQPNLSKQPNILIVVLDSLSASNMSLYGYPRRTTPNITRFAENATVFHHHYAAGNFTTTGTASLLTGTYPWSHHAFNLQGMVNDLSIPRNLFNLIPSGTYTTSYSHNLLAITLLHQFRKNLNELGMPRKLALKDLEYSDLVFNNDYDIAFIGENLTLRGNKKTAGSLFLTFLYQWLSKTEAQRINETYWQQFPADVPNQDDVFFLMEDSIDWAIEQAKTLPQPYLAYFHFLPPHGPYTPRRDFLNIFKDRLSFPIKPESFASEGFKQPALRLNRILYDEYLAYADSEFGRLFDAMEKNGSLDNTYLILTSDHGELFERGIRGHVTPVLYEPIVHIPLIISKPGGRAREDVNVKTSAVDLLPTILNIYGQPIPGWHEGQVLPTFADNRPEEDRTVFALDSKDSPKHGPVTTGSFMAMQGDYKLLHYESSRETPPGDELYNLASDPEELENLIATDPAAAQLKEQLTQKLKQANQPYSAHS